MILGGKSYNEKSNIKTTENVVGQLFSHIEVKNITLSLTKSNFPVSYHKHSQRMLSYPGLNVHVSEAMNSGLKTTTQEDIKFEALGKLGDLGLGFFNDINIPVEKGGLE